MNRHRLSREMMHRHRLLFWRPTLMRELLTHLPIVGTCGVIALLAGPLARLPINLLAWLLEWLVPSHPGRRSQTGRFTRVR